MKIFLGTFIRGLALALLLSVQMGVMIASAQEAAPAAGETPAPTGEPAAPAAEGDSLDVTITGEARDEVPIAKEPPSLDVPFDQVVSLSREGQRDHVLAEAIEYMTPAEHNELVLLDSKQAISPLGLALPKPPFFRMELPAGVTSQIWEFRVIDQSNITLKTVEGLNLPEGFLEWDGYDRGGMRVLVGPAYSPVLTLTDVEGKRRRYFGEAIQLDAMQYEQDGLLHLEFNNNRLYERDSPKFSKELESLLDASLELMRHRAGTPLRVIVYANPQENALTQKRLEQWKKFLLAQLLISAEDLTLATLTPKDRGEITAVMMLEKAQ